MARAVAALTVAAAVCAVAILAFWIGQNHVRSAPSASPIDASAFAEGMGVYLFNDDKYSLLIWKQKIVAPPAPPEEKELLEAMRQASVVKKNVRFFTYGMDFSTWPVVPPYLMAFCIVRDAKTIDGIYPIRVRPLDQQHGFIYELLLPPIIEDLSSGALPHLFWAINFQYSCNDGWVFRFESREH